MNRTAREAAKLAAAKADIARREARLAARAAEDEARERAMEALDNARAHTRGRRYAQARVDLQIGLELIVRASDAVASVQDGAGAEP